LLSSVPADNVTIVADLEAQQSSSSNQHHDPLTLHSAPFKSQSKGGKAASLSLRTKSPTTKTLPELPQHSKDTPSWLCPRTMLWVKPTATVYRH